MNFTQNFICNGFSQWSEFKEEKKIKEINKQWARSNEVYVCLLVLFFWFLLFPLKSIIKHNDSNNKTHSNRKTRNIWSSSISNSRNVGSIYFKERFFNPFSCLIDSVCVCADAERRVNKLFISWQVCECVCVFVCCLFVTFSNVKRSWKHSGGCYQYCIRAATEKMALHIITCRMQKTKFYEKLLLHCNSSWGSPSSS